MPLIAQGWLRTVFYLIALLLTMFISVALFTVFITPLVDEASLEYALIKKENFSLLIIFQSVMLTSVTLLTIFFRNHIDKKDFASLGFLNFRIKEDIVKGIITGFACIAGGFVIIYFTGHIIIKKFNPDIIYITTSLIFYLMVSWIEELSFRGYILNNLLESFHPFNALFISSILFAFFHILNTGISVLGFMNLFLAGILLGIVFIHTKTIWFALSLHFSWNFFQGPVFGFYVSGTEMKGFIQTSIIEDSLISGGKFGFEGSIICTLLITASIFILYSFYNKNINLYKKL